MKYIILVALLLLLTGCMVIWTDHVFVYTFAKTVDANDLNVIVDPNQTMIGSRNTKTKNDKVKTSVIVSGVPIIIESK